MRRKGSKLEFISWINRDGSGTSEISSDHLEWLKIETFEINALSATERTFIASGFNSFVVKLKSNEI